MKNFLRWPLRIGALINIVLAGWLVYQAPALARGFDPSKLNGPEQYGAAMLFIGLHATVFVLLALPPLALSLGCFFLARRTNKDAPLSRGLSALGVALVLLSVIPSAIWGIVQIEIPKAQQIAPADAAPRRR
jgi:hypothetical protein